MAARRDSVKSVVSISEINQQNLKELESKGVIIYSPPTVEHWASQSYWLCNLNSEYALLVSQSIISDPEQEDIETITRKANLVKKEDGKVDDEHPLFIEHAKKLNESSEKNHFIKMTNLSRRCFDSIFVTVKQSNVEGFPNYFILRPHFKGMSIKNSTTELSYLSFTQKIRVAIQCVDEYRLCHMADRQGKMVAHVYNEGDNINLYLYRDKDGEVRSEVNLLNFEFAELLTGLEVKETEPRGHYTTMAPELYGNGKKGHLSLAADIYILAALMIQIIAGTNPLRNKSSWLANKEAVETPYDFLAAESLLSSQDPLKSKKISIDLISLIREMTAKDYRTRPDIMNVYKTLKAVHSICSKIEAYRSKGESVSQEEIEKAITEFSSTKEDGLVSERDLSNFKVHQHLRLQQDVDFKSMRYYLHQVFKTTALEVSTSQSFAASPACNGTHHRQSPAGSP